MESILKFIYSCLEQLSRADIAVTLKDVKFTTEADTILEVSKAFANRRILSDEYDKLAVAVYVQYMHRTMSSDFETLAESLKKFLAPDVYAIYKEYAPRLDGIICPERDYDFTFAGLMTFISSYSLKIKKNKVSIPLETPQQMFMRVAIGLARPHKDDGPNATIDFEELKRNYTFYSKKFATHASSTLYSIGTNREYLSSCFLMSLDPGVVIDEVALKRHHIDQMLSGSGGVGISMTALPGSNSSETDGNGTWDSFEKYCQVVESSMKLYETHGSRRGSVAVYIEPWHIDFMSFLNTLQLTNPNVVSGRENEVLKDLFAGIFVPTLFFKRFRNNEKWTLFNPQACPDLMDLYGEAFERRYIEYEAMYTAGEPDPTICKQIDSDKIMSVLMSIQMGRGFPYIVNKDACNILSMHNYRGTIRCSNLCSEIVQYSSFKEPSVCSLGSLCLNEFVHDGRFDYTLFQSAVDRIVRNVTRAMNISQYKVDEAAQNVEKMKSIAIGVQGLADVYQMLSMPYLSLEARQLNVNIFAALYYFAMTTTVQMAKETGQCFDDISKECQLHHEKFFKHYEDEYVRLFKTKMLRPTIELDWETLNVERKKYGMYNSLLIGLMPTSSTSMFMCNNESFEPYKSNTFKKRVIGGEFQMINRHLFKELNGKFPAAQRDKFIDQIIKNKGSLMGIPELVDMVPRYLTAFELDKKRYLQTAIDRAPYIDQSQSLNHYTTDANDVKIFPNLYGIGMMCGLKTCIYYLVSLPKTDTDIHTFDGCGCTA